MWVTTFKRESSITYWWLPHGPQNCALLSNEIASKSDCSKKLINWERDWAWYSTLIYRRYKDGYSSSKANWSTRYEDAQPIIGTADSSEKRVKRVKRVKWVKWVMSQLFPPCFNYCMEPCHSTWVMSSLGSFSDTYFLQIPESVNYDITDVLSKRLNPSFEFIHLGKPSVHCFLENCKDFHVYFAAGLVLIWG